MIAHKLIDRSLLPVFDQSCHLSVTNGCFDLFGPHHAYLLRYLGLQKAGGRLIVGINSDESVARLKGTGRPIQSAEERAFMVSNHEAVDHVFIFNEDTFAPSLELLNKRSSPCGYEWFKGGDYTHASLSPDERLAYQDSWPPHQIYELGDQRLPTLVPPVDYPSTTETIKRIHGLIR